MSYRISLARTVAFAMAYLVSAWAGRLTVVDGTNLSMVWPAAGVAVIWFCAQRRSPWFWVDGVVLITISYFVNALTGATHATSLASAAANFAQALVFVVLLRRWRPSLWGAGGDGPIGSPRDLWILLAASCASTACGAFVGPTTRWLLGEGYPWVAAAVWLARNTAGTLIVGMAGLCIGQAVSTYRARHGSPAGWARQWIAMLRVTPRWRIAEYAGLAVCTTSLYMVGFRYADRLPLSFAVLGLTVWVATRLATPFVVAHSLLVATIAALFTLNGQGPFAVVGDLALRTVILQAFAAMVAVVGLALALGRDERDRLMAELAAQREQASRHAALMTAIVDSMADGLAVIDSTGGVVLRNPASVRLLGDRIGAGESDPAAYGFFRADGSRYLDEEAFLKALADEEVRDAEILVRNPGVPEGRFVRVTATALPNPDGTRSAVVLYHDVTAERRHRDELTNFAGVVAHDLLNPVASVDGWTDAALEALATVPAHPGVDQARGDLARLARASDRMRSLIEDLLAYTTARNAVAAPAYVDLTAVVADIANARTDAAAAAGRPEPRFTVGAFPPVHADPVLVRQLLDNLIGNAIKYTAPGVTPALTVTAAREGDMVRVCVADNGIGIPEGQHDAIFANFHRAHLGSGYLGTGLGLAICQRIVERHGGTIAASDNPGGGSRFVFTLPAATPMTAKPRAGSGAVVAL
ncbi:putative multi-sensor signal transduction histidine kinase [Actinoplanes missouriensis 431]|uniref:Sensor-like histidine kinase SenX3 n=1 Tax=Actinoplanes missouriensis (strain ATCC 14538 / DSM 43046 / CBS 188.64 / JCM 3121 / NBRC 102363 / NCIMB 12654 / NRRL B-3342 / UNCC 431) TaxID=512565 RepID=I0GY87_ACTM4|nr:ATP-binding protein [Actinoplanes missouriensis]BAL85724.1 putative multi-sensor signal transduction histidine kinase [Actinoplanes missouriensis 431]